MAEQFAREICRVAAAQICKGIGYDSAQVSAIEALTDVIVKYLEEVGYNSHMYAELANRTEGNLHDVRMALADHGVTITSINTFRSNVNQVPFAKPLPQFPVPTAPVPEVEVPPEHVPQQHIPEFLPPFPPKHTYVFTPAYNEEETDATATRQLKNKRKRQVEESLAQLSAATNKRKKTDEAEAVHSAGAAAPDQPKAVPEFFSTSRTNPYVKAAASLRTPVIPSGKHTRYMNEDNPLGEGEKAQRTVDLDDDAERQRKSAKWEKILAEG
eukprot:CAMPEP_0114614014 /NCGR_PEP_ID=MMETSP0168-20121206/5430_1 /TAXON_ID=95228 ORGANISM="Vannella sp., Strain DIVA3 517/6/12" /NCGR_SAMPLE_ID=MMETSP0168 /ASSEMBLY_ACC=CAM_ASM_000044 /LENGTH=269 /DNA_ID=CAMNT_0001825039 /DNA_START=54 /DNA_END=863 /DNA_ORIENTATION=+